MSGFRIGPYALPNRTVCAPMAGVTDRPFRKLCKRLGAGMAVSEMTASNPRDWHRLKFRRRIDHADEVAPRIVQIAGGDPADVARAAVYNVEHGAQIIDINMGCPAKKVLRKRAGSALLEDEALVEAILRATVEAVTVPVTLKIRTGPDPARRNAVRIARIAEDCGIQALAVHGRTRACRFRGVAEYETIAAVVDSVDIPVIANGDIDTPQRARDILERTGADAIMIGRAAQGNPWIFKQICAFLENGSEVCPPSPEEVARVMLEHVRSLHRFYGERTGLLVARKHLGWYLRGRPGGQQTRERIVRVESGAEQLELIAAWADGLAEKRAA